MKIVLKKYSEDSSSFELEDASPREPEAGEVLVRVYAASVNPIDSRVRSGYGKAIFAARASLPYVLGRDFSGKIIKVGAGVTEYKEGDDVWGVVSPFRAEGVKNGSHSTFVTIPTVECHPKPKNMSFVEAASIPYVALTTWMALITQCRKTLDWYRGKKVLVHAGAGGVGSFAIQFLKILGARVTTTCSAKNCDFVRSLGADEVIDYQSERYGDIVRDCDAVYDLLGKEHTAISLTTLISKELNQAEQDKIEIILQSCLEKLEGLTQEAGMPAYKAILKVFDDETRYLTEHAPVYVSIVGPLMPLTDALGLSLGMQKYVRETLQIKAEQLKKHGRYFSYSVFEPNQDALAFITDLANKGAVKPQVGGIYTLYDHQGAYRELDSGHARGKIVFEMPAPR